MTSEREELLAMLAARAVDAYAIYWRTKSKEFRPSYADKDVPYTLGVYHGFRDAYHAAGGKMGDLWDRLAAIDGLASA